MPHGETPRVRCQDGSRGANRLQRALEQAGLQAADTALPLSEAHTALWAGTAWLPQLDRLHLGYIPRAVLAK